MRNDRSERTAGENPTERYVWKSDLMTGYLVRRIGQMGLTLFLIVTLNFFPYARRLFVAV